MEGNSRGIVKRVGTRPPSDFRLALLFINFLSSHVGITSGVVSPMKSSVLFKMKKPYLTCFTCTQNCM